MRSWRELAAHGGEQVYGRTLVELLGKDRLIIERHRGVHSYSEDQILVGASFGRICVTGRSMGLCCMSREQLCVTGRIDTVELIGRDSVGAVE